MAKFLNHVSKIILSLYLFTKSSTKILGTSNSMTLFQQSIKLNATIFQSSEQKKKNCMRDAGVALKKKDEYSALSVRSDVAGCDKNQMHGRYLIVPESTYGSCHMPLTPPTYHARWPRV